MTNTVIDLYLWRSKLAAVIQQFEIKSAKALETDILLKPSRIKDRSLKASQLRTSLFNTDLKKFYSMGDSYFLQSYKESIIVNVNENSSKNYTDTPLQNWHKQLYPKSLDLPDGAFISLAELYHAICRLKPVHHARKNNRKWATARVNEPQRLSPCTENERFLYKCGLTSDFPRRSDVPDGAFISVAELNAAIAHLRPLKINNEKDGPKDHPVITKNIFQESREKLRHIDDIKCPSLILYDDIGANVKPKHNNCRVTAVIQNIVNPRVAVVDKKIDIRSTRFVISEQPKKTDKCFAKEETNGEDNLISSIFSFVCCLRLKVSTKE